jgi:hypothetical protein
MTQTFADDRKQFPRVFICADLRLSADEQRFKETKRRRKDGITGSTGEPRKSLHPENPVIPSHLFK